MTRLNKYCWTFGAWQTIAMAVYHFFIPQQFQWHLYLKDEAPTINWGLITINYYFSFLLLLLGLSLLLNMKRKEPNEGALQSMIIVLCVFWLVNTIYQLFNPMPLPTRLFWLVWLLPGISLLNGVVMALPYIRKLLGSKL